MRSLGTMSKMRAGLLLPAAALLVTVAACGRDTHADDALGRDLALAAQSQPYAAQQYVSPTEQGLGPNGANPYAYSPYTAPQRAPIAQRAPSYPTQRSTARRSSGRASSRGSGGDVYYPSQPSEPVRHTQRDAAIGAAAGAIIGASTSRDKVKGGLIGAAAGAVLGGIVGHTVDVERRP